MPYTTIEKIRAKGYLESAYSDEDVEESIELTDSTIDRICDQFFDSRVQTRPYDGSGTGLLVLDVPIVAITQVEVRTGPTTYTPYDLGNFAIYLDDKYPRIKIVNAGMFGLREFPQEPQAIKLTGTFGYAEVPLEIQRAALRLAISFLTGSLDPSDHMKEFKIEEETEDHRYKLSEKMVLAKFTGIAAVDRVLGRYKRKSGVSNG